MWYNTVEFYVIAGALAAAAVVAAALPSRRAAAKLHLAGGELSETGDVNEPSIEVRVDDNGRVLIRRRGLSGIAGDGAVSLAINVIGFDVAIEERLTPGHGEAKYDTADFELDFFARERYHVKYNSEDAGVFTAFTLNVSPGIKLSRPLK